MVVCINRFATDADEELRLVVTKAEEYGATGVVASHWAEGGAGALELAREVIRACERPAHFR